MIGMLDAPARLTSRAEEIAESLRGEIASGHWTVGDCLPAEYLLMERFAASRPTCREALRILQSERLIEIRRGHKGGARVTMPDVARLSSYAQVFLQMRGATVQEVFQTRMAIEPGAVREFALRADGARLSQLSQNVAAQKFLTSDPVAFYEKGREFRQLMMAHCGNESLRLVCLIIGQLGDQQLTTIARDLVPTEIVQQHYRQGIAVKEALIDAVIEGKPDAAADRWRDYLAFHASHVETIQA